MSVRAYLEQWLHRQWMKRGLFSWLLRPLSGLSALYIYHKRQQPRHPLPRQRPPIIVVGNIIIGGAGKTPVVLALCRYLQQHGWTPGIVSRGYGVTIAGAARVGQGQLDAMRYGDEPSLLAEQSGAPIAVHPKRVQAVQALMQYYPEVNVIIADDGLQHQALIRDIEIVVQDQRGVGNGLVLPAGPLREPPERLTQADWLITQTVANSPLPYTPAPKMADRSVHMQLVPAVFEQLSTGQRIEAPAWLKQHRTQRGAALAAIGQPQRFFQMLKNSDLQLDQELAFPDHGQIPASIFSQLKADFLLITAKDAVKCSQKTDSRVWAVHVEPQFTPASWLDAVGQQLQHIANTTPH